MRRKAKWIGSSLIWPIDSSILLTNDSEITNSTYFGVAYVCSQYLTPKANNNTHVPIASTCTNTSLSNEEIQVTFNITTPNVFTCNPNSPNRKKKAWYDTLLGGTGTTLGVLNGNDLEIVRNKLAAAGKDSVDALHILGDWSPTLLMPQLAQLNLDKSMVTQLGDLTVLTGDLTKGLANWTMCAVRFLWMSQLRDMLETRLTSPDTRQLRFLFKIPVDYWVMSFPQDTVCHTKIFTKISSFYCVGHYKVFVPRDYGVTMCKLFTLPIPLPDIITNTVAWWRPKYDGSCIAVGSNNTYSLADCQKD